MTAITSRMKSDPPLSVPCLPAVEPPLGSNRIGAQLPVRHMQGVHNGFTNFSSASEPNLPLFSFVQTSNTSSRPSSVIIEPLVTDNLNDTEPDSGFPKKRPSLVHFQPRVRIASGIPRRQRTSADIEATSLSIISPESSLSSSPAPSIYAPLRTDSEDEDRRWGSLGQRVKYFAIRQREQKKARSIQDCDCCAECRVVSQTASERTPLIGRMLQPTLELQHIVQGDYHLDEGNRQSREIDFAFGTWPRRLLNRYWWWWRLEPILCCYCLDESDVEY